MTSTAVTAGPVAAHPMSDVPSSSRGDEAGAPPARPKRLPQLEDFPSAGPNALGGFQQRIWARILDELLVQVPVGMVFASILMVQWGTAEDVPTDSPVARLWPITALVVHVLYETITVALAGRTGGKWLLGLKVARYTDGKRPTWGQAALRALVPGAGGAAGQALAQMPAIGSIPVLATAFFDPLRRGVPDKGAGTIVIRTR